MKSIIHYIRARRVRKAREDVARLAGFVEGLREAASVEPDAEERWELADAIGQWRMYEERLVQLEVPL